MKSTTELATINPSDLVITPQSFGLLRKEIFKNIGKEITQSIEELIQLSIQIHVKLGHV